MFGRKGMWHYKVEIKQEEVGWSWKSAKRMVWQPSSWRLAKQSGSKPGCGCIGENTPSISRRGNSWDDAPMENFFGHLKEEYLRHFKQSILKGTKQPRRVFSFVSCLRVHFKSKAI